MSGYNCCQSVFTAYSDLFGLDRDTSLRLSCSFGAGMGRMREVCGTVSAMFMIAGLVCGNTDPADQAAKTENYETVRRMAAAFKAEHKTIICREILGLRAAEKSAAPSERTPEYYRKRPCVRMVATAARIIEDTFPELFSGEEEAGLPGADRHPDPDKEAFPGEQEIFSVYDDDGKPLGQMKRGQVHRLGLWHEVVHCWMYARQGDTVWLYFQQRAASKKDFPGFYDLSSTGHVDAHEEHAQAVLREVREETGLTLTSWQFRGLVTFISDVCRDSYMHLFTADGFTCILDPDCSEGELQWFPWAEMRALPTWEGDQIFLDLLEQNQPFFSLKLRYEGENLVEAVLDGSPLTLKGETSCDR